MSRLMTPAEAVEAFNLPSVRTIRTLRSQGLPTVKLGSARLIDYDDMVAFVERMKEQQCHAPTEAPSSSRLASAQSSTSPGSSMVKSGSAQRARQTAEKLKRLSQGSSANDTEPQGRVIRASFR
ncbi:hypothetical protein GGQ97_002343 [Sphingomonas kaistensis]|uniref:DNA-binding protein n=1 Tax=Sphingomonas kaistensis TaxID=298708 RepID=A0A7X5Y9R9_9SPHN|nr:helix-turn-helix domain-containing protein [Sphingomonas kaistensis]NJC06550.1 hypothetical protein [Sphingomonas kaistensis]